MIQQFTLPSESTIVGFYPLTLESADLANESRDLTTPTNLGGCVIVTSNAVYQCKQMWINNDITNHTSHHISHIMMIIYINYIIHLTSRSPELVFLGVALSTRNYHMTDEIALTYKLDVCELYQVIYLSIYLSIYQSVYLFVCLLDCWKRTNKETWISKSSEIIWTIKGNCCIHAHTVFYVYVYIHIVSFSWSYGEFCSYGTYSRTGILFVGCGLW